MSSTFYTPQRVMAIFAHPDDIEFGCAGTLARWIQEGATVCCVLVTSGDVGIAKPEITRDDATAIREAEQRAAAEVLGVQELVFLREPDGMVENTLTLRKRLVQEIRRFRPEVVVCGDPTAWFVDASYVNHPDHRAVAAAAIEAVFPAAGQPHFYEELAASGLLAHKVRKIYVDGFGTGDTYVNISATIDLKIAALRKHVSQMGEWDPEPMLRKWSAEAAKGKEMEYAEGFRVITLVGDEDWVKSAEGCMKRPLLLVVAILALTLFGPQASAAPQASFDPARALAVATQLAATIGERPAGSLGEQKAAGWLAGQFAGLGYEVQVQAYPLSRFGASVAGMNVVATKAGAPDYGTIYIGAHYDTVYRLNNGPYGGPGANDNASGTGVLLELARVVAGDAFSPTLKFIAFGAEEDGLVGSRFYVNTMPFVERMQAEGMLNLDCVGLGEVLNLYLRS